MPHATLLVATHHRPKLLDHCLQHAERFVVPDGWTFSIVVGLGYNDPGRRVASRHTLAFTPGTMVTDKFKAALAKAPEHTDLYLMTGDDDMHSPNRLSATIDLFNQGHKWISAGNTWYANLRNQRIVKWVGDPARIGTFFAFEGKLLRENGWPDAARSADAALLTQLNLQNERPAVLPVSVGDESICCYHGKNIGKGKPFPLPGKSVVHGAFRVTGYHPSEIPENIRRMVNDLA